MTKKLSLSKPVSVGAISCAVAPVAFVIFFLPVFNDVLLPYYIFLPVLFLNLALGAVIGGFIGYLFIKKNWVDGKKLYVTIILVTLPIGFIIEFSSLMVVSQLI